MKTPASAPSPNLPPAIAPYDPATIPNLNGAKDRAAAFLATVVWGHREPTAPAPTEAETADALAAAMHHIQAEIDAAAAALPLIEQAAADGAQWIDAYSLPMAMKKILHEDSTA